MARMVSVTMKGDKEIARILNDLEKKMRDKIVRKMSRGAAKIIQKEEKATAPRRTGTLANDIRVKAMKRSRKKGAKVGVLITLTTKKVPYASFIEYGTKFIEAVKFAAMAFERKKNEAAAMAEWICREEISKVVR